MLQRIQVTLYVNMDQEHINHNVCIVEHHYIAWKGNKHGQIFTSKILFHTVLLSCIFKMYSYENLRKAVGNFPLLSLGYTFHTPLGSGHAQWACHSLYKVLSFSYPFRPDEVHSSGWKLVFNESTVLFLRKSTSTITTTEWETYIKLKLVLSFKLKKLPLYDHNSSNVLATHIS